MQAERSALFCKKLRPVTPRNARKTVSLDSGAYGVHALQLVGLRERRLEPEALLQNQLQMVKNALTRFTQVNAIGLPALRTVRLPSGVRGAVALARAA